MSTYNGRRAPNVSQYVANLNTIPSAADMAAQQDFPNFDDDLALFTNTQFFDFDMNEPVPNFGVGNSQAQGQDVNKGMGFANQPNFPYNNFPSFAQGPSPQRVNHVSPHSLPPSPPNGIQSGYPAQQSQPTVPNAAQFHQHNPQQPHASGPQTGEKRKSTTASLPDMQDLEESSRNAAEEDKRRRNTAASARFRVKKKQREQALEKTAKEMSEKVQVLEARVGQLEMENKWLKGLIMEKNLNVDMSKMSAAVNAAVEEKRAAKAAAAAAEEEAEAVDVKAAGGQDGEGDEVADADIQNDVVDEVKSDDKKRGVGTKDTAVEA